MSIFLTMRSFRSLQKHNPLVIPGSILDIVPAIYSNLLYTVISPSSDGGRLGGRSARPARLPDGRLDAGHEERQGEVR